MPRVPKGIAQQPLLRCKGLQDPSHALPTHPWFKHFGNTMQVPNPLQNTLETQWVVWTVGPQPYTLSPNSQLGHPVNTHQVNPLQGCHMFLHKRCQNTWMFQSAQVARVPKVWHWQIAMVFGFPKSFYQAASFATHVVYPTSVSYSSDIRMVKPSGRGPFTTCFPALV